jgi:hypothetical protein
MSAPTYADLVQYLIVSSYGGPQDAEQKDIRQAILRAYDELTTMRDWAYYSVHGRVVLQGTYTTGTVEIDGGGVTGDGTTWSSVFGLPSNPTHFTLRVADRNYRIAGYSSATVLSLTQADSDLYVAAGAPYALFRSIYPLPADFRNMDEPSDEYNWWSGLYVTPDEAMKLERVSNSSGEPYHWTLIKTPGGTGWALKVVGYPTKQETLDFTYRRSATSIASEAADSSTRLDIADHMGNAMYSAAEYWLARIRKTGEDRAYQLYQRDLRLAMEQDQLAPLSGRSREVWHDGGWRSPLEADRG